MMRYYYYFNKDRVNQVQQINNSLQLLTGLEKEKQQELKQVSVPSSGLLYRYLLGLKVTLKVLIYPRDKQL
jgi:hypothetical protein